MKRPRLTTVGFIIILLALAVCFFTACHKQAEVKAEQQIDSDVSNDKHEETYQDAEKNKTHEADTSKTTQTETQKGSVATEKDVTEEEYEPAYPYTPEKPIPPRVLKKRTETKTTTTSGETTKKQTTGEAAKINDTEKDRTQTSAKVDVHEKASASEKIKIDDTTKTDVGLGWKGWLGISVAAATALLVGFYFVKNMPWAKAVIGAVKGVFGKG